MILVNNRSETQGCADGGRGGITPPILSNLQGCWSKSQRYCERAGHSISCDLNSWSNGQMPPKGKCLGTSLINLLGPVYMEASFPVSRVSRLDEFPGMYRECTVLHFTIYMDSRETRLAGIPADRSGIWLSRVSRSTHINTNNRVSRLSGTKGDHRFLADCITAIKNTLLSSKSVLNSWTSLLKPF